MTCGNVRDQLKDVVQGALPESSITEACNPVGRSLCGQSSVLDSQANTEHSPLRARLTPLISASLDPPFVRDKSLSDFCLLTSCDEPNELDAARFSAIVVRVGSKCAEKKGDGIANGIERCLLAAVHEGR